MLQRASVRKEDMAEPGRAASRLPCSFYYCVVLAGCGLRGPQVELTYTVHARLTLAQGSNSESPCIREESKVAVSEVHPQQQSERRNSNSAGVVSWRWRPSSTDNGQGLSNVFLRSAHAQARAACAPDSQAGRH